MQQTNESQISKLSNELIDVILKYNSATNEYSCFHKNRLPDNNNELIEHLFEKIKMAKKMCEIAQISNKKKMDKELDILQTQISKKDFHNMSAYCSGKLFSFDIIEINIIREIGNKIKNRIDFEKKD